MSNVAKKLGMTGAVDIAIDGLDIARADVMLGDLPAHATLRARDGVPAGEDIPLHRDTLQKALEEFGLVGVTLITVDETWSSMRVRPL